MRRESTAMRERGYMSQLDALRCFAIVGVIVEHNWKPRPLPWIFANFGWGELGVQLFFVLSGFLITGILLRGRTAPNATSSHRLFFVRQFYIRRFLRIFPIYYAVLVVLLIAAVEPTRSVAPWLLTYTTNIYIWHFGSWISPLSHFWTLAVEEQFYLVWPWLLLFAPRRWLIPLLVGLIAIAPAYRLFATYHYHADIFGSSYTSGTATVAVVDSLAAGALLAIVVARVNDGDKVRRTLTRVVLPVGLLGYLGLLALDRYGNGVRADFTLGRTTDVLIFCWLIGSASYGFGGIFGRLLEWRPIAYLGKISYGIYIFHNLVPVAFATAARHLGVSYRDAGPANFVASFAVTIALASLSWHLFEGPINRLKRFFPYRAPGEERVPAPVVAAVDV
jgi:peptidoglycan/LPS O-acetylase OafA/YrhL